MQFSKEASTILIVDDNKDNLDLLSGILVQEEYQVRRAINGTLALKTAVILPPSLVLLDINMPDISGFEVCQKMKQDPKTRDIPIIFISALNDVEDKVKAFAVGGVDYITKPFKMSEVLARVETHLTLATAKREVILLNQVLEQRVEERTLELEQRALELEFQSQQLQEMNQNLKQEIVQRQRVEEQLLHVAYHDPLTNLPNRGSLLQALEQLLAEREMLHAPLELQAASPESGFAVIYLDCDRFKVINDCLGHDLGDQILLAIAERLQKRLPETAQLYRQGGDEFTILLRDVAAQADVARLVQSLADCFEQPFLLQQHELFLTASFGIVLGHGGCGTAENILRDVDTAMYHAKADSNLQWQFFDQAMHQRLKARLELENEIRRAIENQDFSPVYQPIIDLKTGLISGFETLIRWHHKTQGFISPGEFIPVAEEAGLIIPIDLWVLQEACRQTRRWQTQFFGEHAFSPQAGMLPSTAGQVPWKVSVNLSVKQFSQPNLLDEIDRILLETGLSGQSLKLEITETAIMENADSALRLLQALKQRGIQLAIDDFGTGYSSLSYLHRFPVDTLKIDQLFVSGLDPDFSRSGQPVGDQDFEHNLRIVRSAVNLAHELDMDVVAEGIETQVMREQLLAFGCDYAQGYLLGRPLNAEALEARLVEQHGALAIAS